MIKINVFEYMEKNRVNWRLIEKDLINMTERSRHSFTDSEYSIIISHTIPSSIRMVRKVWNKLDKNKVIRFSFNIKDVLEVNYYGN